MPFANVALCAAGLGLRLSGFRVVAVINNGDCVAIFHSVHRVMKAEKILKQNQLDILLIPVPRELSADCGLAIRFALSLRHEVVGALSGAGLQITEIWLMQEGNFQLLT